MKTRDIKELHTKTAEDIRNMLTDAKTALADAWLEHAQRKLTNTTSMSNLRRDIARMQTVLQAKTQSNTLTESSAEGGKDK
jgi:ribosomal protein L29